MDQTAAEFRSMEEWERWLAENHSTSKGVWIRLYRKGSPSPSVTVAEALDVTLCYGSDHGPSQAV